MPRQTRPAGPYYTVDEVWQADVKRLLKKRGISHAELARQIGASPGSIVLLFKPDTVQSRLIPAIHKVLGLDPPTTTTITERDDAKRRLDRIWRDLTDEERELLITIGARIHRSAD